MCFRNKPYQDDCKLEIGGLDVSRLHVTKFLGLLGDEKLSWYNHNNALCKNLSKNMPVIYKGERMLENTHLCGSLILPYLSYACEMWEVHRSLNYIL